MQANPIPTSAKLIRRVPSSRWTVRGVYVACLMALAPTIAFTQASIMPISQPPKPTSILIPEANPMPDANERMKMREQLVKKQNFEAANLERKKQIDDDSKLLLKLAADLKAEFDKTGKDALSLSDIRKAEMIERLARNVKEKMKLTIGAS